MIGSRDDHHASNHSAESFESFTWESDAPVPVQTLNAALARLPRTAIRAKGLLHLREKLEYRCVLQATAGRAAITVGQPWGDESPKSRLVFIGSKGGVDATEIPALFEPNVSLPVT